jgi:Mor family transcriptional regulator
MVNALAKKTTAPTPHRLSPLFDDGDLVDRIFEYILEQFPAMAQDDQSRAKLGDMKQAMREEFSGAEFYIPKRSPTERQQLVAEVLRLFNGRNATEIARRLQISRATVYRVVKQPAQAKPSQVSET